MALVRNPNTDEFLELRLGFSLKFIVYVVNDEPARRRLMDKIRFHMQSVNMNLEEISLKTETIDGPVAILNDVASYDTPQWWHSTAFAVFVSDMSDAASDKRLYPKINRLLCRLPLADAYANSSQIKFPAGSLLRAIITVDDLEAFQTMQKLLSTATGEMIFTSFVRENENGYWIEAK